MRVRSRRRRFQGFAGFEDERGVTAIIVGICAVMLFGFAAIAVDAGNLWSNRRHVILASDSAALAAAQEYALGGDGCALAPGYVEANHDGASLVSCTPTSAGSSSGAVTVVAEATVDHYFASIIGFDADDVSSLTTAMWGTPASLSGLRPLGFCNTQVEVATWLDLQASGATEYDAAPIPLTDDFGSCGDAPGNWGYLDFDGGSNPQRDIADWTRDGYDGEVSPGPVDGNPGNRFSGGGNSPVFQALEHLRQSGEAVCFPIFDSATAQGQNATFQVIAFVGAVLQDYQITGQPEELYIDLKFTRTVCQGDPRDGGTNTGVFAVNICEVDHSTKDCT